VHEESILELIIARYVVEQRRLLFVAQMTMKTTFMDNEVEFSYTSKLILLETKAPYKKPFCSSILLTIAIKWDSC
jgi:hypothetical protein